MGCLRGYLLRINSRQWNIAQNFIAAEQKHDEAAALGGYKDKLMEFEEVRERVSAALAQFTDTNRFLVEHDPSERCIASPPVSGYGGASGSSAARITVSPCRSRSVRRIVSSVSPSLL